MSASASPCFFDNLSPKISDLAFNLVHNPLLDRKDAKTQGVKTSSSGCKSSRKRQIFTQVIEHAQSCLRRASDSAACPQGTLTTPRLKPGELDGLNQRTDEQIGRAAQQEHRQRQDG